MGSSKYYKLWVRAVGDSAWTELTRFTGMQFEFFHNIVATMKVRAYVTASATQDKMKAGTRFRITTNASTNGTVATLLLGNASGEGGAGREIMTGYLGEPHGDEKTAVVNSKPIVWDLLGWGFAERLTFTVRNEETSLSGTANSVINSMITEVNTRAAGTLVAGTIDTGPTININNRKDEFYSALLDIASVGDATVQRPYYIYIDANTSYVPRINYYSPSNALFDVTNPFSPRDEGRIIDEKSEVRSLSVVDENDRIVNAILVRYGGFGSDIAQTDTAMTTDATSITNFGRRELIHITPWIRDSTTGNTLRDTILNTFKGGTDGLTRAIVVLKSAELFGTAFDAKPGDEVGVERAAGQIVKGRFLGFQYDQATEALTVFIGPPRFKFFEEVTTGIRATEQHLTAAQDLGGVTAPNSAQYLVLAANTNLTDERVFVPGAGLTATDGGSGGNYTVDVSVSTGLEIVSDAVRINQAFTPTWAGLHTFQGGVTINTAGSLTITDRDVVLSATTGTKFGTATTQKLSFFGAVPVARQAALTAADNTAIDATYDATEQAVLNNVRTRLNELEARFQAYGYLP